MVTGLLISMFLATPAFAVRTILYYENECCRNITEGEFAILYCQGLKLKEPAQGWTVQTAAAALSALGHQPEGGWVLSRFLSEAVMARLIRNSPFYRKPFTEPATQKSDLLVTIARARNVVPSDEGLTQGEFAVLLALALKIDVPPGCSPDQAIKALSALPTPVKPAAGWNANAPLRESDMTQILVPTPFRPTSIDPTMTVPALQAYSLLFGKYEIATQGHFGLFIVEALGVPAPAGRWTKITALDYLQTEFGVASDYGWNVDAPLCAEIFENGLRQIAAKLQKTSPASPQMRGGGSPVSAAKPSRGGPFAPGEMDAALEVAETAFQNVGRQTDQKEIDAFIGEVRRGGLIPADRCAIIPMQGLMQLPNIPPPPQRGAPPVSPTAPPGAR